MTSLGRVTETLRTRYGQSMALLGSDESMRRPVRATRRHATTPHVWDDGRTGMEHGEPSNHTHNDSNERPFQKVYTKQYNEYVFCTRVPHVHTHNTNMCIVLYIPHCRISFVVVLISVYTPLYMDCLFESREYGAL